MKKETIIKGKKILDDLERAEDLAEKPAWSITFKAEDALSISYYNFESERAKNMIENFTKDLLKAMEEEMENYKGEE